MIAHAHFAVELIAELDHALVHERLDAVDDVDAEIVLRVGHGLGRLERAPADEDRDPAEQPLLRFVEQVVAPGDRAPQRLLAFGQIARAAGQDLQPALESSQHRRGRQRLDARRRQLEGQRQPVEAVADLGNGPRILAGQRKVGL